MKWPPISTRKSARPLFQELESLGAQSWLTGADPLAFAELKGRADCFTVSPGRIVPG